jgi:histone-lysine N-methyltransferase SETMAR
VFGLQQRVLAAHARSMDSAVERAWLGVLRRATPRSLAAAACTCKALHAVVLQLRARDVSCSSEDAAVLAPSAEEAAALRAVFVYTSGCSGAASDAEDLTGCGCDCTRCEHERCGCALAADKQPAYTASGLVRPGLPDSPLVECGPACSCSLACPRRVTQRRLASLLSLRRDALRGWGVVTDTALPAGAFVCTYAGELITLDEARRRLTAQDARRAANYIMVLREHVGERLLTTCVDPTARGNVGRFLNHACDGGNLELRAVRSAGWPVPRIAFFTRRRVAADEELTYSYGAGRNGVRACHCGTSACSGWLPFDDAG